VVGEPLLNGPFRCYPSPATADNCCTVACQSRRRQSRAALAFIRARTRPKVGWAAREIKTGDSRHAASSQARNVSGFGAEGLARERNLEVSRTSRGLAHTAAADTTVSLVEAIAMRFGQRRDSVDRCTPKATRWLADLWNARWITLRQVSR
jgi:hypothetical protein